MKILIVTGIYPPDIGGPATHLAQVTPFLSAQGSDVSVVTFGSNDERRIDQHDVSVSVVNRDSRALFRFLKFSREVYRASRGVSIMYVHDMSLAGLAAYVVAQMRSVPYVLRLGGDFVWEQAFEKGATNLDYSSFQGKEPFPYSIRRWISSRIARGAHTVVVPSMFLAGIVKGWGVKKKRIHVVPNAVDENVLVSGDHTLPLLRQVMEWRQEGKQVIVSSGRFVKWKHFDILARAARDVVNVEVLIIGSGPEEEHLRSVAAENVSIVPSLSRRDLAALFREVDCFVLLSEGETFSFISLEAYLSGLPVVMVKGVALEEVFGEYTGKGAYFLHDRAHKTVADALRHISRFSPPSEEDKEVLRSRYSLSAHLEAIWGIIGAYKRSHGE